MSHRLQVLIPEDLDARLRKAAQRSRMSKGRWVRQALEEALHRPAEQMGPGDPLVRMQSLNAPTADIKEMLSEIEAGRS